MKQGDVGNLFFVLSTFLLI